MPEPVVPFDVFISYNNEEVATVSDLCERLRDEGKLRPWRDKDAIQPGLEWERSIEAALDSCPCCAVMFGPHGWSEYHFREVEIALRSRKNNSGFQLIPVLLPGALDADLERLPTAGANRAEAFQELKSLQWVDFRSKGIQDDEQFLRLVAGIQGRTLSAEEIPGLSPYRINKDAQRWKQAGRSTRYLYSGGHLEEAERLAQREPDAVTPLAVEFLTASAARARRNRRTSRLGIVTVLAVAIALYFIRQMIVDAGFRKELVGHNLPAGIYGAPALESFVFGEPLASLDWIQRPLTRLDIAINEDGTPNNFPAFLADLTILGQGDGRSVRYDVDVGRLPSQLSSLRLKSVELLNPDRLRSLEQLKALSLHEIFLTRGAGIELPPGLDWLDTDLGSLGPDDIRSLSALKSLSLTGSGYSKFDARLLPNSLASLSLAKLELTNPSALSVLPIQDFQTDDLDLLDRLPKSVTSLSLTPANLNSQKLASLRDSALEKLVVELPESPGTEREPPFDMDWVPTGIHELSFRNVTLLHGDRLKQLTALTKVSWYSLLPALPDLPESVQDLRTTYCMNASDLQFLPTGLRRLALGCLSEFARVERGLQRFPSLTAFSGLELSDDIELTRLPDTLQQLAISATSGRIDAIRRLKNLTDLSLDLRPGTGGSDVPGSVDENLSTVDVKDLPRSLRRLQVSNLKLANAEELANFDKLVELTVDHYNRGIVGIPKTLKKLIIKGEVNTDEFRRIAGFRY